MTDRFLPFGIGILPTLGSSKNEFFPQLSDSLIDIRKKGLKLTPNPKKNHKRIWSPSYPPPHLTTKKKGGETDGNRNHHQSRRIPSYQTTKRLFQGTKNCQAELRLLSRFFRFLLRNSMCQSTGMGIWRLTETLGRNKWYTNSWFHGHSKWRYSIHDLHTRKLTSSFFENDWYFCGVIFFKETLQAMWVYWNGSLEGSIRKHIWKSLRFPNFPNKWLHLTCGSGLIVLGTRETWRKVSDQWILIGDCLGLGRNRALTLNLWHGSVRLNDNNVFW